MLKKSAVIFMSLILTVFSMTACSESNDSSGDTSTSSSSSLSSSADSSADTGAADSSSSDNSITETVSSSDMFSDGDYKDVTSEEANAEITLSGSTASISDTTRGTVSDGTVTITSKGVYRVSGSSENVTIMINDDSESGNIYLILDGVTMKNSTNACIYAEACDKLIIQCVGENTLEYTNTDSGTKADGAIYSKDDVTLNGSGKLSVNSSLHGIVCKDDLKITDSQLTVNAESIGIKAGSSLRVGGGTISVTSGHDGVQISDDENDSSFYLENADMTVSAGYDGISVKAGDDTAEFTGFVTLNSGTLDITSGGGSDNSKDSSTSQKGIKTDGNITIGGTTLTVSSADDAVHGNSGITINSGTVTVSSSDDGITASDDLVINGGSVTVDKSYEGLEGANITINDGTISIVSSDDGINTSGGSDSSQTNDDPWNSASTDAKLTINGGSVYVNASGDGLDSNGSLYVTGGTVIVEGPTDNGNGALDIGDGNGCVASITGGTVVAVGSTGMAVNFNDGTQCSALVNLSGSAGDTISVDDGSGFIFTATKSFDCVVYSSPSMTQGNSYTITAGSSTATADFSSSLYYSDVSSMGGNMGGMNDRR